MPVVMYFSVSVPNCVNSLSEFRKGFWGLGRWCRTVRLFGEREEFIKMKQKMPGYPFSVLEVGLLAIAVLLMTESTAHAYIDPGTGSALIQGLIAVVAALGVTLKLYWHRVIRFLGLGEDKDSNPSDDRSDEQSEHFRS